MARRTAAKNAERATNKRLLRKYGITLDDYDRMLKSQRGGCAICGVKPKTRRLDVDHDHKTKRVRGLLCHRCNRGLAWYSDSPDRLRAAARYLSK